MRTKYVGEVASLEALGATEVVAEEFEAASEVLGRVLRGSAVPPNVVKDRIARARRGSPAVRRPVAVLGGEGGPPPADE